MPDIFISYARQDQAIAADLARKLTEYGYDVWWDRELAAGDEFRYVIQQQLQMARAVIVIWSQHAIASRFVCDEADDALSRNKLVPTRVSGFDPRQIPLGFRGQHTQFAGDLMGLVGRLGRLGVAPSRHWDPSALSPVERLKWKLRALVSAPRVAAVLERIDRALRIVLEGTILFIALVTAGLTIQQGYFALTDQTRFDAAEAILTALLTFGLLKLRRYVRFITFRSRVITMGVIAVLFALAWNQ